MLDLDWATVRINAELPANSRAHLYEGTESYRDGVYLRFHGKLSPNIDVVTYPDTTIVSGSPHKHLHGESVAQFGPAETRVYAAELSDRLQLPLSTVLDGRISRFDLGANLVLTHRVADYIQLTSPPRRMHEVGSGPDSTVFKHGRVDILFYDKVAKVKRRHAHLVPRAWASKNVLRIEVRFKRPALEFKRRLSLADLCDDTFWVEAADRWLARTTSVPLAPEVCTVPFAPTPSALRSMCAARGVEASGGRVAVLQRISEARSSGVVTATRAKALRRWVASVMVEIEGDCAGFTVPPADELAIAIRSAPSPPPGYVTV